MGFLTTQIQRLRLRLVLKLAISFSLIIFISMGLPTLQSLFTLSNNSEQISQTRQANEKIRLAENADQAAAAFQSNLITLIDFSQETINNSGDLSSDLYTKAYEGYIFERDVTSGNFKIMTDNAPNMLVNLNVAGFSKEFQNSLITLNNLISNAAAGDTKAAAQTFQADLSGFNQLKSYSDKFKQYTADNLKQSRTDLDAIYQKIDDSNNNQRVFLLGFSALLFILAGLLGLLVTRSITRPLRRLVQRLQGLAEGDLIGRLYVDNRDEFGQVADTFNTSVEKLNRLVSRLQKEADNIGLASTQINRASQEQARSFTEQTIVVNQLMTKVESLAEIARQIDQSSNEVALQAQQATFSTENGQDAVRQSIVGMTEIEATVKEIVRRILTLNEKTQAAGKLASLIENIADETHLLALNAAIESAGAGEEGSRFSVVAKQVKQLASRTREAVKSTQIILHEIQLAAGSGVMATEQGLKGALQGVELAHLSGEANEAILDGVQRTAQLSQSISNATTVQLQASEDLVVKMRDITETISENAFGAQQTTISAAQLDEIVEQLLLAAKEFRVQSELATNSSPTWLSISSFSSADRLSNEMSGNALRPISVS